jgi:hypothetical protein
MAKALAKVVRFYVDGFKNMKLGKTLWLIIAIKLAIMFLILKPFFFPNFLNLRFDNDSQKAVYVGEEFSKRTTKP